MSDRELIDRLSAELAPVRRVARWPAASAGWLLASLAFVIATSLALGPYRPGFAAQLLAHPQFLLEMIVGTLALATFAAVALAGALPGRDNRWVRRGAWMLLSVWLAFFLIGPAAPSLEPSMLGKREHCALEAYLYSVPPLLALLYLQRRRFVLHPYRAVIQAAVAAGLLPALAMQLACMYEPVHILQFHVLPVAILTTVAVIVTWLVRQRTKV